MRRPYAKKHPRRRLWRCFAAALALLWLLLALCWYVEDRFEPILDELAEYEVRAAVTQAVNAAVSAELAAHPQRYAQVYRVQYNGTVPAAVQADAAAMNEARLALVAAVNAALQGMPRIRMRVPFGTLTGFSLLNNLGPGWPLSFAPEAFAEGTIRESAETVGINSTRYRASLTLTVTINMVLDGKNRVLYAASTVPVASVIVSGETPLYYAAGG